MYMLLYMMLHMMLCHTLYNKLMIHSNLPPHTYIMFDIRNNNHQHVLHYHIDLLNNTCCEYIVVSGILI